MAETPPLQIRANADTPPTPLHGAAYDRLDSVSSRYPTRLSQRRISRDSHSTPEPTRVSPRTHNAAGTPRSSRRNFPQLQSDSPQTSPKSKSTRRVQVVSPSSPDFAPSVPKATSSSNSHLSLLSSTTTMGDGMLPTPVKTPKKKNIPHINSAARALFQEEPIIGEGISPRRARKGRRYNGFTLESFSADDGNGNGRVQIFTDSRDRVPEVDTQEDNPFLEKAQEENQNGVVPRKATRASKRRKVSGEKKKDPQVQEAIDRDEGMVYVFRGKKVYKRFDDAEDEEEDEEIESEGARLLESTSTGAVSSRPIKPLTRRSIKPKRLFQTEQQLLDRERQKQEEAETDVEDGEATTQVEDSLTNDHSFRSIEGGKPAERGEAQAPTSKKLAAQKTKKGSPFDSWKRTKPAAVASTSTSATSTRGKKRGAQEMASESTAATKRSRSD